MERSTKFETNVELNPLQNIIVKHLSELLIINIMEFKKKQISNSCIRNTVFFIVTILVTIFKNQIINFFTSEGFLSREYYFRLSLSIYKDENLINSTLLILIAFFVVSIFLFNYFIKSMNILQRLSRLKKSYQRMLETKKESEVRVEKLDQEAVKEEHNDTNISIHESITRVDESEYFGQSVHLIRSKVYNSI